ncbi:MAG: hypothetical protein H0X33_14360 [Taibaiella sp.]|nr:hypothetical protein [Taibaiella sp.]
MLRKKNVVFFSLLLTTSCGIKPLYEIQTSSEPYVQLKNGRKYSGPSAQRNSGMFVKDRIVLGDTSFKSKDVAVYSTGNATYANVGRKAFAPQVAAGKISLFKYDYTTLDPNYNYSGIGPSVTYGSQNHVHYYIQQKEGDPIKSLTYSHLSPMLSPNTPEFTMLKRYKNTRTVSRVLGYGALGMAAAGFASHSDNVGGTLIAASFTAFIGWACVSFPNRARLLKAVLIADKAYKRKGHFSE